jgi:signal transduction histidine kinase
MLAPRRYLVVGGGFLLVAIVAVAVIGTRVLARDRAELYDGHARDRQDQLEAAARALGDAVGAIGENLELAAILAAQAESNQVLDREMHAIAALTREYLAIDVWSASGHRLVRVIAPDARADILSLADAALDDTVAAALADPGAFKTSRPLAGADAEAAWYRVFARRSARDLVVAFVVDMRPLLDRLRLLDDGSSALLVLGTHGLPAPSSDPALAAAVRALDADAAALPGLDRLIAAARARRADRVILGEREARAAGLPEAAAIGIAAPVLVEDGEPWALVLLSSTAALRAQERTLVRRLLVGAGLSAALLVALSAYVLRNAHRAAALQERLRHLDAQRRLEDRLLHSEKLATAGQLAAGIAHEIGTPLNIVRGRAELTVARLGDDHPQAPGQRVIIDQIDHVSRLIAQLLDFVRPSATSLQAVAPATALAATAELISTEASKRDVTVEVDASDDVPPVRADPGQLRQVLLNLAVNALDACASGGRVTLRARRSDDGDAALLEVVDDGAGIPAESRAQIFDPFFTTKKRGQGTGLGLWVVAQLVQAHGAEITVDSAPGAGTTFRLRWPAAGPPAPGAPAPAAPGAPAAPTAPTAPAAPTAPKTPAAPGAHRGAA